MPKTWGSLVLLAALLVASVPAGGVLGIDDMSVPAPREGDVGLYRIERLTLDGEPTRLARWTPSVAFELGGPRSVEDAYGETRTAFRFKTAHLVRGTPWFGTASWFDHRGMGPLRSNLTVASHVSGSTAPLPTGWEASMGGSYLSYASADRHAQYVGGCGLLTDLQGDTLQEDARAPLASVCDLPLEVVAGDGESIEVTVDAVDRLEDGNAAARVVMDVWTPSATLTVVHWYRSDVPYPLEVSVSGELSMHDLPGRTPGGSQAVDAAHHWSQMMPWIPWGELTVDRDGDGRVAIEGAMTLDRFGRGQGQPLPDGPRSPWASRHQDAAPEPLGAWGPKDGGETFTYSLREAVETVRQDPRLVEFQAWLDDTSGERLAFASLRTTTVPGGGEQQTWTLHVVGPSGDGWTLQTRRATGAELDGRHVDHDVPADQTEASYAEEAPTPYPGPRMGDSLSIPSALEIWRETTASGRAGASPGSFTWWDTGESELMRVGHTETETVDRDRDRNLSGHAAESVLTLDPETGLVTGSTEGSAAWGMAPVGDEDARETKWQAPGTRDTVAEALSAPVVTALRVASAIVLLLVLLAKLGLLPFYSWLDEEDLLDNDVRRALYEAIGDHPGISLTQLAEVTEVARSTVRYHLRRLEAANLATSLKGPDARRFFHAGDHEEGEMERHAVLATGRTRDVFQVICASPGASLTDVSEAAGMPLSSTHRIVERLVDAGLVTKQREGRSVALTPTDETTSA